MWRTELAHILLSAEYSTRSVVYLLTVCFRNRSICCKWKWQRRLSFHFFTGLMFRHISLFCSFAVVSTSRASHASLSTVIFNKCLDVSACGLTVQGPSGSVAVFWLAAHCHRMCRVLETLLHLIQYRHAGGGYVRRSSAWLAWLERLRKITKWTKSLYPAPGRDLNPRPHEYEVGVQTPAAFGVTLWKVANLRTCIQGPHTVGPCCAVGFRTTALQKLKALKKTKRNWLTNVPFSFHGNNTAGTERRGRVVWAPASYSGGPGLILGPETGYPDRIFVVFLGPSKQMPG
jgi:hypothetical protein